MPAITDRTSPAWRAAVLAWVDERLAAAGVERRGPLEDVRRRPWATVLRARTSAGPVWFKAAGPGTMFEARLYEILAAAVPRHVLVPIGTDVARGWMLLPDGGPSLGERAAGEALAESLTDALVRYGELQRALDGRVDALLAAGVADMRPAAMPDRFEEALVAVERLGGGRADPARDAALRRVAGMRGAVRGWCEELAAAPQRASLDHNDLHPGNVLDGPDGARYYDWGDSVVAHPFAAMLVPLAFVRDTAGGPGDPRFTVARDAYLGVFGDTAPRAGLVRTLELACRVAKVARALTWIRALQAAHDEGDELDERWASAPLETLASLLDAGGSRAS